MEIKEEANLNADNLNNKRNYSNSSFEISSVDSCLDYLYNIRSEISSNINELKEILFQIQNSRKREKFDYETLSLVNNPEEYQEENEILTKEAFTNKFLLRNEDDVSTTLNQTGDNPQNNINDFKNYFNLKNELSSYTSDPLADSQTGKKRGKRGKYLMYSEAFKEECIEEVKKNNGNEKDVAKFYNIPLKKLKRWIEIGPKRLEGGGRKVMDPQMEVNLIKWINSETEKGSKLSGKEIQDKAKYLSKVDKFLASKGWLEKFLKKYDIKIVK